MSELNEDILNYEIGDVDADDTDLTGVDEDDLLLSDDESISGRLVPNTTDDDAVLSSRQHIESEKQIQPSSDQHLEAISKNDNGSQISDDKRKSAGSKFNRTAGPSQVQSSNQKSPSISPENEMPVVSSTFKEDDEIPPQPTQSQSVNEHKNCEPTDESDEKSESTAYEESESHSHSEQTTDTKSESTFVSQDTSEENNASSEQTLDDYDGDDSEGVRERRNPKLCVEREMPQQKFEDSNKSKPFSHNYQRNRHSRPQMQRPPYCGPPGPDFNPAFMGQFRGARRPMPPISQSDFIRGHSMMMRGPPNHMQRGMPPGMLGPRPNMLGPPHGRLQRPPFQPAPGMFGNNPGMPPQGMLRPRGPPNAHQQMMQQRPPFVPFSQPNHPANMRLPMNPSLPPHAQPINAAIPSPSALPLPIIGAPRKVLINPNFKGGVQAATNQLMMDTMKNSQIMENKREEELLRQQEAFINQNRMHIEKRRRSREHSPERDREYRDRDRERSFSPPRRRERGDGRKPYGSFRENRMRRADSRDRENPDIKKKRGEGDNNQDKSDPKTDEDEETRAYRLEIEKQKAQREKILRDKEMRRRKAAEELKKDEDKKVNEDATQKLTPIIVTEKKIISLKKKSSDGSSEPPQKPKALALTRKLAASENVVSESGSQTKTVLRSSSGAKKLRIDSEDIDEDELLADSPPSTPATTASTNTTFGDATLKSRTNASKVGDIPTTMFTNRRVVVRNVDNVTNNENNLTNKATTGTGKGIFDRLDKKVISVTEAAKRKIQRIVINNSD